MSIAAREQVVLRKEKPQISEVRSLISAYQKLRNERGDNAILMSSYWQEAKLYAYQLKQLDSAVLVLNKGILLTQGDDNLQAQMKLELGDILTYKGKKYDALIQYAQVEKQVKDSPLAYEAKIKTAKVYFVVVLFLVILEVQKLPILLSRGRVTNTCSETVFSN